MTKMAKEKQENDLETGIKADASVDVAVDQKEKNKLQQIMLKKIRKPYTFLSFFLRKILAANTINKKKINGKSQRKILFSKEGL